MAKRDYYEVLGVSREASVDDIRKAFRREALKHHPDKNAGNVAAEGRFKECNEAHQVLTDASKRRIYDEFGHAGLDNTGAEAPTGFSGMDDVFSHMQDIFSEMFGHAPQPRHGPAPKRGRDLKTEIELTLREAVFGCKRKVPVISAIACPDCGSTGAKAGTKPEVCGACGGQGQVTSPRGFVMFTDTCPYCNGAGHIIPNPCPGCLGRGAVEREREIMVGFAAGIEGGQTVRVPGQGMPGSDRRQQAGDLYVEVSVLPDSRFERNGYDLLTTMHIMFTEAVLGGEAKVPLLDPRSEDATATLRLTPGTQAGQMLRITNQGVPRHDGSRGALVVIVHIDMPKKLSKRAIELVTELNRELMSGLSDEPPTKGLHPGGPAGDA